MKIKIVSIGNKPPKWISQSLIDYTSRMKHHCSLEWVEIKSETKFDSIVQKKKQEANKILHHTKNTYLITLDEDGHHYSSKEFSKKMSSWIENFSSITFVIGGADGLDLSLINSSSANLSLSKMTLPHHLVKIFLAEQIYRSLSILNNHPYHRE
ncbi:23S rRNA (pseudouridine(1915)-N(3))-methyltransferase RlmH [Methylophilaceae bacterium]|jgi:23S rRNA (pseudouridine1915-N3)-methyltransferase|nr:23S rRNA (pseudouridine(1915)-N(3))-methyltransferase RlmH [Methylophilaceae bacterium]|tara:strand:+ start:410 stop:871 length:462 start_codon:yes stop_codon:yes gene_type:complete